MNEISRIGISSTLMSMIAANPKHFSVEETVRSIVHHLQIIKDLQKNDSSDHTVVRTVYMFLDTLMNEMAAELKLSCHKGCAHCCKMNVDTSPMEVALIVDHCKGNSVEIDQDYLKRQAAVPKTALASNPEINRCVFLTKNNLCSIYPVRPLACRKYVAMTPFWLCDQKKYPTAKIGVPADYNVEVLTSALDNFQSNNTDSLHKLLLQQLDKT